MHPVFKSRRRLLGFVLACLLAGAALAGVLSLAGQGPWPRALAFALPLSLAYGFIALASYFLCRSLPERRLPALLALYVGAPLVAALAGLGLAVSWNGIGPLFGAPPLMQLSSLAWLLLFAAALGAYLLALLAHELLIAFERAQAAAQAQAEALALAREAELQLLRTQVNPHFLFNCLNSISALTQMDPAGAREMAIELAQFFRRTLALADRQWLSLDEELALCGQYLAIEQRRFGPQLKLQWEIEPEARGCDVPAMCLQPLVENAVKHGVAPLGGGTVRVAAALQGGQLKLEVSNPFDPLAAPAAGAGLGLRNLRARLEVLYGRRARIEWRQGADEGFVVALSLPEA
ncbi:sensor histidine kinase [Pelomonas sp. KK5]|uniref:sensor histidine kinase n=1 Tax=Pelomonas sp. KK5 TaxID=1855730 RepID=UPI00097C37EC|nr:histidine kinase [Pelomonas sp. KK5]